MSTPWWRRPPERGAPNESLNDEPGNRALEPARPRRRTCRAAAGRRDPSSRARRGFGARLLQAVLQLALALLACEPLLQLLLRRFRGRERAAHVGLRRFEVRDEVGLLPELVVELGLLQVQILGHRAELIDRRVALPVDPVEELAAPHRFEHIRAVHDRIEVGVAAFVRLERAGGGDRTQRVGVLLEPGDLLLGPVDVVLERVVGRLGVLVPRGGRVRGLAGRGDARFGLGNRVAGRTDRLGRHQEQRKHDRQGEGAAPRRT